MVSRLYLPRTAPYSIAIAPKKTASVIFSSFVRAKHEKSGLEAHQASKQSSVAELSNKPIHSDEDVEDKKSLEGLARDDLNLQDRLVFFAHSPYNLIALLPLISFNFPATMNLWQTKRCMSQRVYKVIKMC